MRLAPETIDGIEYGWALQRKFPDWKARQRAYWAVRRWHREEVGDMSFDDVVKELLTHPGYREEDLRKKEGDTGPFGESHTRDILAGIRHNDAIRRVKNAKAK